MANPTNWHVDNPYDPFYSRAAIMLWVALDDATVQNGCLYFLDGTHLQGDVGVQADLSRANVGGLFRAFPEWGTSDPSVAEVRAGAGIFINGMLAHAAGPNMTSRAAARLRLPVHAGRQHLQWQSRGPAGGAGGASPGGRPARRRPSPAAAAPTRGELNVAHYGDAPRIPKVTAKP